MARLEGAVERHAVMSLIFVVLDQGVLTRRRDHRVRARRKNSRRSHSRRASDRTPRQAWRIPVYRHPSLPVTLLLFRSFA